MDKTNKHKNLLLIEYSNGEVLTGDKEDQEYIRWAFNTESSKATQIIDTHLLTKQEANEYLKNKASHPQYSI